MEQIVKEHSLHLEKNTLTVNGVTNVETFDSKQVIANLNNNSLAIKGDKLVVVDLDIKGQTLILKGEVHSVNYGKKSEKIPFIKRIFK